MLKHHLNTGKKGEVTACDFLKEKGYSIIDINYRIKRYEVDIIAKKGANLVFFEVKTRTNTNYGMPEVFVDEKKADNIRAAAEEYLLDADVEFDFLRFDIIAVVETKGRVEVEHFEDAF